MESGGGPAQFTGGNGSGLLPSTRFRPILAALREPTNGCLEVSPREGFTNILEGEGANLWVKCSCATGLQAWHFPPEENCWGRDSKPRGKMLKSRTFLKKTRAGGVMKIVREHYLRDDIGCGASGCAACGSAHEGPVLEPQPLDRVSSLCPQPHYLLPDTNVLLHQVRR